jgi:hypothetical protein
MGKFFIFLFQLLMFAESILENLDSVSLFMKCKHKKVMGWKTGEYYFKY